MLSRYYASLKNEALMRSTLDSEIRNRLKDAAGMRFILSDSRKVELISRLQTVERCIPFSC